MAAVENKVKFGLKNVHYALLTVDEAGKATYASPEAIPGAVNLSLEASGDESKFYADNMAYYVTAANDGYTGTLEMALIPDKFRQEALGEQMDATNKILVENSAVEGKSFALLFEFNGDQKSTRHVLYNCTATRPGLSSETTTNAKEPVTETLNLTAAPLANGNVKAKTTAETTEDAYNAWYATVWQPADEEP